jgi:hypothetical protein
MDDPRDLFRRFVGNILGPPAGAVEDTQDAHCAAADAIGNDIGRALNHEFARPFDSASATALWELRQTLDLRSNAVIHRDSGSWAILFDVVEDCVAIGLRENGSFQTHDRCTRDYRVLRRAEARRLAKCASTFL